MAVRLPCGSKQSSGQTTCRPPAVSGRTVRPLGSHLRGALRPWLCAHRESGELPPPGTRGPVPSTLHPTVSGLLLRRPSLLPGPLCLWPRANVPKPSLCLSLYPPVIFWDSQLLPSTSAGYFEKLPSPGTCLTFPVSAPTTQQVSVCSRYFRVWAFLRTHTQCVSERSTSARLSSPSPTRTAAWTTSPLLSCRDLVHSINQPVSSTFPGVPQAVPFRSNSLV